MPELSESAGGDMRNAESAMEIARKIQSASIPRRLPMIDGLAVASLFIPSSRPGGECFECFPKTDDTLAFFILEASRNSPNPVLLSLFARDRLMHHIRSVQSPRAAIERVNAELIGDIAAGFCLKIFVGCLDLSAHILTYSNAGNIGPQLLRRNEADGMRLSSQGAGIGIAGNEGFKEETLQVNPGDRLLIFSDGILPLIGEPATASPQDGLSRFLLEKSRDTTPEKLVALLQAYSDDIANGNGPADDLSFIAIEVLAHSQRNEILAQLGLPAEAPVRFRSLSRFDEIDGAVGAVLEGMDSYGYPDDVIRKMKMVLIELLANAILHGNGKDPGKKVVIGHVIDFKKAVISIVDEGNGFAPQSVPDPTLPENLEKSGGRGLFIVRHFVDAIEHNAAGNRVTITKCYPCG